MKKFINNKIIISLLIIFILISCFFTSSFAAFQVNLNDKIYTFPEVPADGNSYCILFNFGGDINLFTSSVPILYSSKSGSASSSYLCYKNAHHYCVGAPPGTLDFSDKIFLENSSLLYTDERSQSSNVLFVDYFVYSNHDVYSYSNKSELVFQRAPQGRSYQIQEITQVEEIPKTMAGVLQVVIPVGLIILLVGLVILVSRLVILRMI